MGLLDDFRNEPSRVSAQCRVEIIRSAMTTADVTDLDDALADVTITAAAIERVLARKGIKIKSASITRHRRGECTCGK